jgi:hypothetical protein
VAYVKGWRTKLQKLTQADIGSYMHDLHSMFDLVIAGAEYLHPRLRAVPR